jgi:hypothetical protein
MTGSKSERDAGRGTTMPRDRPAHPVWKANLLMAAIVVLLMALAVLSTVGGR